MSERQADNYESLRDARMSFPSVPPQYSVAGKSFGLADKFFLVRLQVCQPYILGICTGSVGLRKLSSYPTIATAPLEGQSAPHQRPDTFEWCQLSDI